MTVTNFLIFLTLTLFLLLGAGKFFFWFWKKIFAVLGRKKNPFRNYD